MKQANTASAFWGKPRQRAGACSALAFVVTKLIVQGENQVFENFSSASLVRSVREARYPEAGRLAFYAAVFEQQTLHQEPSLISSLWYREGRPDDIRDPGSLG